MRIFISGGFGFIAGRLAQYFSHKGHEIILGSRSQIDPPLWLKKAQVVQVKWNDPNNLRDICKNIDIVIHAAGMNADDCARNPNEAMDFNGNTTETFAYCAQQMGVKKFIYISSAHIYSSPLQGRINEECIPNNNHPYATSHLAGEEGLLRATEIGNMQGIVIRLSNAFGAPTHKNTNCWHLLVNNLCLQAIKNSELVLKTQGNQERNFISITEVVKAFHFLIIDKSNMDKYSILNMGASTSSSIMDMARLVQECSIKVLKYKPLIKTPSSKTNKKYMKLEYQTNKLSKRGYIHSENTVEEIYELLKFCKDNFKNQ